MDEKTLTDLLREQVFDDSFSVILEGDGGGGWKASVSIGVGRITAQGRTIRQVLTRVAAGIEDWRHTPPLEKEQHLRDLQKVFLLAGPDPKPRLQVLTEEGEPR